MIKDQKMKQITCTVDSHHHMNNYDYGLEIHSYLLPQIVVPVKEDTEERTHSIEQSVKSY